MAIPASYAGKHVGEDQAITFSAVPNERCTFQTQASRRCFQCSYHTQIWFCTCKLLNVWVRRKISCGSKRISSTPLGCSVLKAPCELLLCQPSPGSTTFVSVRVETEPGKYQQLWKAPSSSSRLTAQPVCCKKTLFTTITNIINRPTVCSDRKLLLTTLILLNK